MGMADGGIDAIRDGSIVHQVKWSSKLQQNPDVWLDRTIDRERSKIRRLIRATSPRCRTTSSGLTVLFQRRMSSVFSSSTVVDGRSASSGGAVRDHVADDPLPVLWLIICTHGDLSMSNRAVRHSGDRVSAVRSSGTHTGFWERYGPALSLRATPCLGCCSRTRAGTIAAVAFATRTANALTAPRFGVSHREMHILKPR